jgi:hypothetical protein
MQSGDLVVLTGSVERVQCEDADRLQHAPPARAGLVAAVKQALVGQSTQEVAQLAFRAARRHTGRGSQVEPTDEDSEPPEELALIVVQQVVAPADHLCQRVVPFVRPTPAGQQPQAVIERSHQAIRSQRACSGRSQLNRQRYAVQLGAHLLRKECVGSQLRCDQCGAVMEELLCLGAELERTELHRPLPRHTESFAAGREYGGLRGVGEDPGDQTAHVLHHVLAVVQHEQSPALLEAIEHCIDDGPRRLLPHLECFGHRGHDEPGSYRGQLDDCTAVRIVLPDLCRDA